MQGPATSVDLGHGEANTNPFIRFPLKALPKHQELSAVKEGSPRIAAPIGACQEAPNSDVAWYVIFGRGFEGDIHSVADSVNNLRGQSVVVEVYEDPINSFCPSMKLVAFDRLAVPIITDNYYRWKDDNVDDLAIIDVFKYLHEPAPLPAPNTFVEVSIGGIPFDEDMSENDVKNLLTWLLGTKYGLTHDAIHSVSVIDGDSGYYDVYVTMDSTAANLLRALAPLLFYYEGHMRMGRSYGEVRVFRDAVSPSYFSALSITVYSTLLASPMVPETASFDFASTPIETALCMEAVSVDEEKVLSMQELIQDVICNVLSYSPKTVHVQPTSQAFARCSEELATYEKFASAATLGREINDSNIKHVIRTYERIEELKLREFWCDGRDGKLTDATLDEVAGSSWPLKSLHLRGRCNLTATAISNLLRCKNVRELGVRSLKIVEALLPILSSDG